MSAERPQPTFSNPFYELVKEHLGNKEIEKPTIGVIAIAGSIGSGSTTISHELVDIITTNLRIPTRFFSSGEMMRKIHAEKTGEPVMEGHFERSPKTDIEVDKALGARMIDLDLSHRLIIAEGRLAPYVAKQIQFASEDLEIRLPSEIITVLTTVKEDVGYSRKYLDAIKKDSNISKSEFFKSLDERATGETNAFWNAYPQMNGKNPLTFDFQFQHQPVYDLFYDTTSHEPRDIAQDILGRAKVIDMIGKTGLSAA